MVAVRWLATPDAGRPPSQTRSDEARRAHRDHRDKCDKKITRRGARPPEEQVHVDVNCAKAAGIYSGVMSMTRLEMIETSAGLGW